MKTFLRSKGLSIVFFLLFTGAIIGRAVFGYKKYNKEFPEEGTSAITLAGYLNLIFLNKVFLKSPNN